MSLALDGGQFGVVAIDDENRQQLCRLGGAGVFADTVKRARRFRKTLAGLEDLHFAVVHLAANFTGQYVCSDEGGAGVVMRDLVFGLVVLGMGMVARGQFPGGDGAATQGVDSAAAPPACIDLHDRGDAGAVQRPVDQLATNQ